MPRAGKMKECSRRPRETDHVSTTCGEAQTKLFPPCHLRSFSSNRIVIESDSLWIPTGKILDVDRSAAGTA